MRSLSEILGGRSNLLLLRYDQSAGARRVSDEELEWQFSLLSDLRQPVALSEVARYLRGRSELPRRGVALTFDAADAGAMASTAAALERRALPATFLVATGEIDASSVTAWASLRALRSDRLELGSRTVSGQSLAGRSLEQWRIELVESLRRMEQMLESPCLTLAFPGPRDSSLPDLIVESGLAGYRLALSQRAGLNPVGALEPFSLRRVTVAPGMSRDAFLSMLVHGEVDQ